MVVYLDVFHTVQHITRKLPKRHPYCAPCLHDFGLVFRSPGDYGIKITKHTPQPPELVQNIDAEWNDVVHNKQPILISEVLEELRKLKNVMKGYLSSISVGGGTNRNEGFHPYLNTLFHKSRLGSLCTDDAYYPPVQYNGKQKPSADI